MVRLGLLLSNRDGVIIQMERTEFFVICLLSIVQSKLAGFQDKVFSSGAFNPFEPDFEFTCDLQPCDELFLWSLSGPIQVDDRFVNQGPDCCVPTEEDLFFGPHGAGQGVVYCLTIQDDAGGAGIKILNSSVVSHPCPEGPPVVLECDKDFRLSSCDSVQSLINLLIQVIPGGLLKLLESDDDGVRCGWAVPVALTDVENVKELTPGHHSIGRRPGPSPGIRIDFEEDRGRSCRVVLEVSGTSDSTCYRLTARPVEIVGRRKFSKVRPGRFFSPPKREAKDGWLDSYFAFSEGW